MNKRPYVRISKISPSEDPKFQTPSFDDYNSLKGEVDLTLPVDYWIEGYLTQEPCIGKPVLVEREVRNGVKIGGLFITSEVTEVSVNFDKFESTETIFKTQNSIYKMKLLKT